MYCWHLHVARQYTMNAYLQQWLRERAAVLPYTNITSLVDVRSYIHSTIYSSLSKVMLCTVPSDIRIWLAVIGQNTSCRLWQNVATASQLRLSEKLYVILTLRLLMSYIYTYGAPSKARNANVVYIWTYVWQRWNSLFLFFAQCFNTESMQRGFLCHICV